MSDLESRRRSCTTSVLLPPLGLALLALAACSARDAADTGVTTAAFVDTATTTVRVAAGRSSPFTDNQGHVWAADTGFSGGTAYQASAFVPISGTDSPELFNSERYGQDASAFAYSFALPAGAYSVRLEFAESYVDGPAQRIFDVALNGDKVLSNFDIYAAAGAKNAAVDRVFTVTVGAGGTIDIALTAGAAQNPKIDAIEIVPASPTHVGTCDGVSCSGHGTCAAGSMGPSCSCDSGYYPSGASCVAGSPDVSVDFTKVVQSIDKKAFGVDCPACMVPGYTSNPDFLSALRAVTGGTGLVRLHGWGMISPGTDESWVNGDGSWNGPKIKAALTPLVQAGVSILIDIPAGPGGDGDDDPARFASFAASLVKIVNVDNQLGVKLWEVPNEQEDKTSQAQMVTLLTNAVSAMKGVDPSISVGGPATAWINSGYIADVFGQTGGILDFVSCHTYGGDGTDAPGVTYDRARAVAAPISDLRARLDSMSPARHIPIFVDEFATGYNYTPAEYDHDGAVYNLIVQASVLTSGGDASAVWSGVAPQHDMSIVDENLQLRDTARLFETLNTYARGASVSSTVSDPSSTFAFATSNGAAHLLAVANLTDQDAAVHVATIGWAAGDVLLYTVDGAGFTGPTSTQWDSLASAGLRIPARSVVVVASANP